jgi:hypothetical protein
MNGSLDCILYIGTEDGMFVYFLDAGYTMRLMGRGLKGNAVRAISVHPKYTNIAFVGCGLRGWGLHMTDDYGASFRSIGFKDQWVWDVVYHPDDPNLIWIGTEPPMIYKSEDHGFTFVPLRGIERVPSRKKWKFFHPPFYGGHIHGITFHPKKPERVLAGVEQGALLFSNDRGESWDDTLVGYDLHRIAYDPSNPEVVLAGAGEGLLLSRDGGTTWNMIPEMKGKYVHGISFDPFRTGRIYVYADEEHSPLYRSDDGGTKWLPIGIGLPSAKPSDNIALHPALPNTLFYAGDVTNRESIVYCSTDAGGSWVPNSERMPKIWRMKVAIFQAR